MANETHYCRGRAHISTLQLKIYIPYLGFLWYFWEIIFYSPHLTGYQAVLVRLGRYLYNQLAIVFVFFCCCCCWCLRYPGTATQAPIIEIESGDKITFVSTWYRVCPPKKPLKLWIKPWWRHQMETFSALLAICAGNSPVPGEFPAQRPVTQSFDAFFDLRLNKWLSKQSRGWWFETLSWSLWRHWNA